MSIFDLHDDKPLPGDKKHRALKNGTLEYEHFNSKAEGEEIFDQKRSPVWIPYFLCLAVFIVLLAQLLKLQITLGTFNRTLAEGNRVRAREINAPRGLILGSDNQVLAKNIPSYNLIIYPLDIPKDKKEREEIFKELSEVAQIPISEINEKTNQKELSSANPIILKENLDRDTAMILEVRTKNLPGVEINKKPIREYANIDGLGPILGYVGQVSDKDLEENPSYRSSYEIGKEGLESFYEKNLKGTPGVLEVEVDSKGRKQRQLSSTEPSPGNNLILSLDPALESRLAYSLKGYIRASNSPGGAAVAMNPQTGEILAIVSLPTYDNNLFNRQTAQEEYQKLLEDPAKPMFNRAIAGTYPSGSTIKPVIAAAGLQEGVITANTTINAPAEIKVGNYTYPDWKAHGLTDVRKAIAESVNIFFYAIAGGWDKIKGIGVEKLKNYLLKFGFGQRTGIDLPGEASGLVPDPKWKEKNKQEMWYLGDTYHLGIGQGDFLVTPTQMAVAISAIANGGDLLKPQLVKKIIDKDGNVVQDFHKEVESSKFIDDQNLQIVREGMRQTVVSGSATRLSDLPVMTAAKTGTAQFGDKGKTHAWMAAYAPYNNPQMVMIVIVEQGGEGYATAGPVVQDVFNWYFSK